MAIQRSTLTEIVTEIRRVTGRKNAALDEDFDNADTALYTLINRYVSQLPLRVAALTRGEGASARDGMLHLDMWRTVWESTTVNAVATLVTTASSSTVYLPDNLDAMESLYDKTHKRPLHEIRDTDRWTRNVERLKTKTAGPPEAYEIYGMETNTQWVRKITLYPATVAGVTPSLTLKGWRIPAKMAGAAPGSEYPDIDVQFEDMLIAGVAGMVMNPDDPGYNRFLDREKECAVALAATATIL